MATAKLDIKRELNAVDQKNYDFYTNLTDEEKKVFSPFILMRYTSNVQSSDREIQEWFVEMTNEMVNKNQNDLRHHKELIWKLYAATGIGQNFYHPYLAGAKKEKANKIEKLLCEIHPAMKMSDIKLMAKLMTKEDKTRLFDDMGFDKKQRKEYE
jgi:hypothetical protein